MLRFEEPRCEDVFSFIWNISPQPGREESELYDSGYPLDLMLLPRTTSRKSLKFHQWYLILLSALTLKDIRHLTSGYLDVCVWVSALKKGSSGQVYLSSVATIAVSPCMEVPTCCLKAASPVASLICVSRRSIEAFEFLNSISYFVLPLFWNLA